MSNCEKCVNHDTCDKWQKGYLGITDFKYCIDYSRATFADRILRKNHIYKKAIEELHKEIDDLKSIQKDQATEIARIKRILEHCLKNNDYELKTEIHCYERNHYVIEKILYIYHMGKEYVIKLPELFNVKVDKDTMFCNILEGTVADFYIENEDHTEGHHFSIEFKVDRYIHTVKKLEVKNETI